MVGEDDDIGGPEGVRRLRDVAGGGLDDGFQPEDGRAEALEDLVEALAAAEREQPDLEPGAAAFFAETHVLGAHVLELGARQLPEGPGLLE